MIFTFCCHVTKQFVLLWYRLSFTIGYVKRFIIVTFALKYLNRIAKEQEEGQICIRVFHKNVYCKGSYICSQFCCLSCIIFQCPQASYHLFHAHLDLRWYHLTVLRQLVKCQSLYITLDDSQPNGEEHKRVDRNTLEEHILLLLSDLIMIAISKFERVRVHCLNWVQMGGIKHRLGILEVEHTVWSWILSGSSLQV